MHFLASTVLGLATLASAVHINFKRFGDDKCSKDHHIRKTSDLHDTTCKSFSHHELGFHSFSFHVTDDMDDLKEKDCRLVVFPNKDCEGEGVTYGSQSPSIHPRMLQARR